MTPLERKPKSVESASERYSKIDQYFDEVTVKNNKPIPACLFGRTSSGTLEIALYLYIYFTHLLKSSCGRTCAKYGMRVHLADTIKCARFYCVQVVCFGSRFGPVTIATVLR